MTLERPHRLRPVHPFDHGEPLGRIELGPLAGVVLVAALIVLGTLPSRTHTLLLDFPAFSPPPQECSQPTNPCNMHVLAMAANGRLAWDGKPVTRSAARSALAHYGGLAHLTFSPAPDASYDATLRTLALIRQELGEQGLVFICGFAGTRQIEASEVDPAAVTECMGAVFAN